MVVESRRESSRTRSWLLLQVSAQSAPVRTSLQLTLNEH